MGNLHSSDIILTGNNAKETERRLSRSSSTTVSCSSLTTTSDATADTCSVRPLLNLFRRPELFVTVQDTSDDNADDSSSISSNHSSTNGSAGGSLSSPCTSQYYRGTSAPSRSRNSNNYSSSACLTDSTSSSSLQELSQQQFFEYTPQELLLSDTTPTDVSNLRNPGRSIWIVTTAALPWMTGTAVNPLLRAAALCANHKVTLVLPWLESAEDRASLYGNDNDDWRDATSEKQDTYIREWLAQHGLVEAAESIKLDFYPARYHPLLSSIFAMGDLCERIVIPEEAQDDAVCLLEEPEHVNFYRAPGVVGWRQKFAHVIGIVHTNYKAYARHHYSGLVTGPIVGAMAAWMVQAYCDKVIKLSNVLQQYAIEKEVVANVHGTRNDFLEAAAPTTPERENDTQVYFLGKLLWAKGLDNLLELQASYKRSTGNYFALDIYGSGPEEAEIQRAFLGTDGGGADSTATSSAYRYPRWARRSVTMPVTFQGRQDHAKLPKNYKIFVNPSVTEVLCTTTAEAVAMGKFVVLPVHPSNEFFEQFPNVLLYKNKTEFCHCLSFALSNQPKPLSEDLRYTLTWDAATERFMTAASVSLRDAARRERVGKKRDERAAQLHYELGRGHRGDVLRKVLGGGPVADQHKYSNDKEMMESNLINTTVGEDEKM